MPNRADALARLGFDADSVDRNIDQATQGLPHRSDMFGHFWAFGQDDTIEIHDFHAVVPEPGKSFAEKVGTVTIAILFGTVWKQPSDVFFGDRSENGVGDCVQEDVGVTVPNPMNLRRNVNPADSQGAAVAQPVRVVSEADAKRWNRWCHVY